MNRIKEIIARLSAINDRQTLIEKEADEKHGGSFSPELKTEYETLDREYATLRAEKEKLVKQAETEASLRAARAGRPATDFSDPILPRASLPGSGTRLGGGDGDPSGTGAEASGAKWVRPKNVRRRVGRLKTFKGEVNGRGAEERAYRFGHWVLARVTQDMPNRFNFRNSVKWVEKNMPDALNVAAGEYEGTTGAHFLVPEEFGDDLIVLRERYGVIRRIARTVPMASDTRVDPRRKAGLTAYFVQQGAAGTESNMQWNEVRLTARDVMVLARYSNQLNADAVINIGDELAGEIAYAFTQLEDNCAFNGDGTSTYGGIVGVRTRLSNVDGLGNASIGLIAAGATGSWANIVLADLEKVAGYLPLYADTDDVCWTCHKAFYYQVMVKLILSTGSVERSEIIEGPGNRRPRPLFLGYPVEFSQVWPNATGSGQVTCALGDFSLGVSFGDRQQDSIAFSEHASIGGQNVFEQNQIAIRGTERFDVNVHDCGDPSNATNPVYGPIVGLTT